MRRELAVNASGQAFLFTQPIQMRCNEMMAGARADIAVKIYGDDFEVLERLATQIRDLARATPGSGDVEFDSLGRSPLLEIRPDRPALRRYTVHAADVNRAVTGRHRGRRSRNRDRRQPALSDGRAARCRSPARSRCDEARARVNRRRWHAYAGTGRHVHDDRSSRRDHARGWAARVAILINLRGRDVKGYVNETRSRINAEVTFTAGLLR